MAASYILAVRGKPITFLPKDARGFHIQIPRAPGLPEERIRFPSANPKWLSRFTALTQMWLSAECTRRPARGLAGFLVKRHKATKSTLSLSCCSYRFSWFGQKCDSISVSSVALF